MRSFLCILSITLALDLVAQKSVTSQQPNRLVVFTKVGVGAQFPIHTANLYSVKNSPKVTGALDLEWRLMNDQNLELFLAYSIACSWEKSGFETYYFQDSGYNYSHVISSLRLCPGLGLKLQFSGRYRKPYVQFGFYSRDLFLKRSITVQRSGQMYFSKGNFSPTPPVDLAIGSLVQLLPVVGPLLVESYPQVEIGISLNKKSSFISALQLSFFDSISLTSQTWSYTPYEPDISRSAILERATLMCNLKYMLK